MGAALKSEARSTDILVHYGGEEFILILPKTTMNDAQRIAEKLRKLISETVIPVMAGKFITISLGIAMRHEDEKDMDTIISRADKAIYQAKNQGRNRVCSAE